MFAKNATSAKTEEVMGPVDIASWAETYRARGAGVHVVGMFIMGVNICSKFQLNVTIVINGTTCQYIPW